MAKDSKQKRLLPRNLGERRDEEIIEKIFGKKVKRELDKITQKQKTVENKEVLEHLR